MAETSAEALYEKLKVRRNKNSEAEIEAEIPVIVMQRHADRVFEEARRELTLPGFRKGQVPADMARRQMNEMHIWEDAADHALQDAYAAILAAEDLTVIGHPEVQVTKMAPGNPLAFTMTLALKPEVTLPDYKKIGQSVMAKEDKVEVTDGEVNETIRQIQMMRLAPKDGAPAPKEQTLPDLTDEDVKKFGPFENVAAFRNKIRENILEEKRTEAHRAKREQIADALIEKTKFALPEVLLRTEAEAMKEERARQIAEMKTTLPEYLKRIGKTEAELEKEERAYAERQMRTRFIFEAIAKTEQLTIEPEAVEWNAKMLAERYPDANSENLRRYVASMILNQKVLDVLEGKKEPEPEKEMPAAHKSPAEKEDVAPAAEPLAGATEQKAE